MRRARSSFRLVGPSEPGGGLEPGLRTWRSGWTRVTVSTPQKPLPLRIRWAVFSEMPRSFPWSNSYSDRSAALWQRDRGSGDCFNMRAKVILVLDFAAACSWFVISLVFEFDLKRRRTTPFCYWIKCSRCGVATNWNATATDASCHRDSAVSYWIFARIWVIWRWIRKRDMRIDIRASPFTFL